MKNNLLRIAHLSGGLLMLCGVVLDFLDNENAKWIFIVGASTLIIVQLFYLLGTKVDDIRKQRIVRLMFIATLLLGLSAYLMYIGNGYWLVIVFIYAILSIFLSVRS